MNYQEINPLFQLFWGSLNDSQKAILHGLAACNFSKDFYTLQDILNGNLRVSYVYQKTIDNAKEYYKEFNKSLLIFRDLSGLEKQNEEMRIDAEAENLKNKWTRKLQASGIQIVNQY